MTDSLTRARRWLFVLGLLSTLPEARAQAPTLQWVAQLTSQTASSAVTVSRVATDPAGNTYVAGEATAAFTVGNTTVPLPPPTNLPPSNLPVATTRFSYVARFDPAGTLQWVTSTGGPVTRVHSLAFDNAGNAYLLGKFYTASAFGTINIAATFASHAPTDDNYLAKLSPQGQWLWARQVVGLNSSSTPVYMAVDGAGGVFITGKSYASFGSNVSVNTAGVFVGHCDSNGVFDWAIGSSDGTPTPKAIATDANGDVYITGRLPAGGATFGTETLTSAGGSDIFLVKVEGSTGAWMGAISAGGPGADEGQALTIDPAGNVVVTASVQGTTSLGPAAANDVVIAHAENNLNGWGLAWATGASPITPTALAVTGGGEEVLAFGATQAPTFLGTTLPWQGSADGYLTASGSSGSWALGLGGSGDDFINDVRAVAGSGIVIGGASTSPALILGSQTLTNPGTGTFGFVARFASPLGLANDVTTPLPLWPNPATGQAQLRLPAETSGVTEVTITDALGRVVRTQTVRGQASVTLDLRGLTPGLYQVRGGALVRRLAVE